jgi:hypothetical protein
VINSFVNFDGNSRYYTSVNEDGKITLEMSLNGKWAQWKCFSREELYKVLFEDKPKSPKIIDTSYSEISTLTSELVKCQSDKAYWQSQHSLVSNLAHKYEEKILELGKQISQLEKELKEAKEQSQYPLKTIRFGTWNYFGKSGWYCVNNHNSNEYLDIFGSWSKYDVKIGENWLFESKQQILELLKSHSWIEAK